MILDMEYGVDEWQEWHDLDVWSGEHYNNYTCPICQKFVWWDFIHRHPAPIPNNIILGYN